MRVKVKKRTIIRLNQYVRVSVLFTTAIPKDCDLLFEPSYNIYLGGNGGMYLVLVNVHVNALLVYNATVKPIVIERYAKLSHFIDFDVDRVNRLEVEDYYLARVCDNLQPTVLYQSIVDGILIN